MNHVSVVAGGWGEGEGDYKGIARKFWEDKELFCTLFCVLVVVPWIYTFAKIYRTVYLKNVYFCLIFYKVGFFF